MSFYNNYELYQIQQKSHNTSSHSEVADYLIF